jgi:hypothetical protein
MLGPNITGEFGNDLNGAGGFWSVFSTEGCFATFKRDGYSVTNLTRIGGVDDYNQDTMVQLNASRSSSVYGKYNTVQPPSLVLNYMIKY